MWTVSISRALELYRDDVDVQFWEGFNFQGAVERPIKIIKNALNQQHNAYTKIGKSHPFLVRNANVSQLDEGDYFHLASLPSLAK